MDGMSDARGTLQGDVVQKHGSLSVASPHGSSGAANRALSPAQNCKGENKERGLCMDSNISVCLCGQFLSHDPSFKWCVD